MRAACGILLWLGFAGTASAVDRGFADIVREISAEYHTNPIHIPLFGLVKTVTFVAHPGGTKQLDLAVFEDLDTEGHDSAALARRIGQIAGAAWKPFVQVRSGRNGHQESTLIFMRCEKSDANLLIVTLEPREATVVHVKVHPEALRRWIDHPAGEASNFGTRTNDSEP
jgi:hypothetical protein